VRALNQWPVHVGTLEIPVWASWIAMVVAGSLCAWAFRSRGRWSRHAHRSNLALQRRPTRGWTSPTWRLSSVSSVVQVAFWTD